jgi:para-nitrobenzyl esterase
MISACDDVLEGKEDDYEHEDDGCCSGGGGGPRPDPDDPDPDDPDPNDPDPVDPDADPPQVEVGQGDLIGHYLNSKVRGFYGIPYAQPPIKALRFLAPQEPDGWSGTRDATDFAPSCIQSAGDAVLDNQDEDCLYLNVWAPTRTPRAGAPVLVWFHGGDHANGSASDPVSRRASRYDGAALAQRGVIVVSVNYRLGPLGFFTHKRVAAAEGGTLGNQGLWDQRRALQWVNDNIASFGGDADNVTIAGQGSGASDVCLHVVSPESRGLFAHVIQQSGGCTTYQPTATVLQSRVLPWLDGLSCDDNSGLLDCLQDKTVAELYEDLPSGSYSAFVPSVGGDFLPDQPRVAFDAGEIADVSFLLGSNSEEASLYYDSYPDVTTEDDYHILIEELFPGIPLKELCEAYPHDRFEDAEEPYQLALAYTLGDGHVVCSTLDTAIRARDAGQSVYLYNFGGLYPDDGGDAEHGAELPFIFGTIASPDDDELDLSNQIQSYWTQFVRDGDPNYDDWPTWAPYTEAKPLRLDLSSDITVLKNFRDAECTLWRNYYDSEFGN